MEQAHFHLKIPQDYPNHPSLLQIVSQKNQFHNMVVHKEIKLSPLLDYLHQLSLQLQRTTHLIHNNSRETNQASSNLHHHNLLLEEKELLKEKKKELVQAIKKGVEPHLRKNLAIQAVAKIIGKAMKRAAQKEQELLARMMIMMNLWNLKVTIYARWVRLAS